MFNYDTEISVDPETEVPINPKKVFNELVEKLKTYVEDWNKEYNNINRDIDIKVIEYNRSKIKEIVIVDKEYPDIIIGTIICEKINSFTKEPYISIMDSNISKSKVFEIINKNINSSNYIAELKDKNITVW